MQISGSSPDLRPVGTGACDMCSRADAHYPVLKQTNGHALYSTLCPAQRSASQVGPSRSAAPTGSQRPLSRQAVLRRAAQKSAAHQSPYPRAPTPGRAPTPAPTPAAAAQQPILAVRLELTITAALRRQNGRALHVCHDRARSGPRSWTSVSSFDSTISIPDGGCSFCTDGAALYTIRMRSDGTIVYMFDRRRRVRGADDVNGRPVVYEA